MIDLEQIAQAIFEGVDEVNEAWPDLALPKSPDTVLIGESSKLDSTSFVVFATSVEQSVERRFNKTISLMDILEEVPDGRLDVAALAERLAVMMGNHSGS